MADVLEGRAVIQRSLDRLTDECQPKPHDSLQGQSCNFEDGVPAMIQAGERMARELQRLKQWGSWQRAS